MLDHGKIWSAIDLLAARYNLSASGLARKAGLDATTFNRSKRKSADGRLRWPSTESLSKVLEATGASLDEFIGLAGQNLARPRALPLIGFAQAGAGGFFDDAGFPAGTGWDEVAFPNVDDEHVYALEVAGDSMLPLYRDGDTIIVSPTAPIRKGDRVVVRTQEGEVLAKELKRRTTRLIELKSLNPEHQDRIFAIDQVTWIARVVWSSQ